MNLPRKEEPGCEFCGEPVRAGDQRVTSAVSLHEMWRYAGTTVLLAHAQCANAALGFDESVRYARWDTREVW